MLSLMMAYTRMTLSETATLMTFSDVDFSSAIEADISFVLPIPSKRVIHQPYLIQSSSDPTEVLC